MLEQHEIEHLLAVGELQRQELMGVSIEASAPGSDPDDESSNLSPPTTLADTEGSEAGL